MLIGTHQVVEMQGHPHMTTRASFFRHTKWFNQLINRSWTPCHEMIFLQNLTPIHPPPNAFQITLRMCRPRRSRIASRVAASVISLWAHMARLDRGPGGAWSRYPPLLLLPLSPRVLGLCPWTAGRPATPSPPPMLVSPSAGCWKLT